jgi:hypothetical protein
MEIQERVKKVMVVNPAEKTKTKKKKKGTSPKKKTAKKSAPKKRHAKRKGPVEKTKKRRKKRKKNPGVDFKGSALAAVGGGIAGMVAGPASHFAGKISKNETVRKILEVAGAGVAPFAIGLAVQLVSPAIGKGICAGAGTAVVERGMGLASEKVGFLKSAGYRMSSLPADLSYADGQFFRTMPDGSKQVLFSAPATSIELAMPDGSTKLGQMLGSDGDNAVILDHNGQLQLLSGVGDLGDVQAAQQLGEVQAAQQLGDESDQLGDVQAAQVLGDDNVDGYSA